MTTFYPDQFAFLKCNNDYYFVEATKVRLIQENQIDGVWDRSKAKVLTTEELAKYYIDATLTSCKLEKVTGATPYYFVYAIGGSKTYQREIKSTNYGFKSAASASEISSATLQKYQRLDPIV